MVLIAYIYIYIIIIIVLLLIFFENVYYCYSEVLTKIANIKSALPKARELWLSFQSSCGLTFINLISGHVIFLFICTTYFIFRHIFQPSIKEPI